MLIDKLYEEVEKISPVCLGLDTTENYLPEYIKAVDVSLGEKIFKFNKDIIDHTLDLVACYKVQIAYYEALGLEGLTAYSKTLKYIRSCGKIVIGDVKRGDISSTGKMYGLGHFKGDFEADIITVNAYMGEDSVSPFYEYIENNEKGIFVLLKTSNPSSKATQDVKSGGKPYYIHMAELIDKWGGSFVGDSGYSSIGAVVGLTYPEEFKAIQRKMPNTFFLVPGYGAQGGRGRDLANALEKRHCAVVNSSRGLITAHKGVREDGNYCNEIRNATSEMKEDIEYWLR